MFLINTNSDQFTVSFFMDQRRIKSDSGLVIICLRFKKFNKKKNAPQSD